MKIKKEEKILEIQRLVGPWLHEGEKKITENLLEDGGKINVAEKRMWKKGKERNSWRRRKKMEGK